MYKIHVHAFICDFHFHGLLKYTFYLHTLQFQWTFWKSLVLFCESMYIHSILIFLSCPNYNWKPIYQRFMRCGRGILPKSALLLIEEGSGLSIVVTGTWDSLYRKSSKNQGDQLGLICALCSHTISGKKIHVYREIYNWLVKSLN